MQLGIKEFYLKEYYSDATFRTQRC